MQVRRTIILMAIMLFVLVACNSPSIAEEMYKHMEEAVTLEETFANQQEPLVKLEEEEKALYDEIITLGMGEMAKVKELAQQALTNIDQREEILAIEKQSIDEAKAEFDKVKPMVAEIEETELETKANELISVMDERYEAYEALNQSYSKSLQKDRELYQMLQKENLEEEELRGQIEEVNSTYDLVVEANSLFNEKTEEYNNLKREFYKQADINVNFTE